MIDDDWMNPPTSRGWKNPPPKNGTYYLIQRKRVIPSSGYGGPPTEWVTIDEYTNENERDIELAKLRKETSWTLRSVREFWMNGHLMEYL